MKQIFLNGGNEVQPGEIFNHSQIKLLTKWTNLLLKNRLRCALVSIKQLLFLVCKRSRLEKSLRERVSVLTEFLSASCHTSCDMLNLPFGFGEIFSYASFIHPLPLPSPHTQGGNTIEIVVNLEVACYRKKARQNQDNSVITNRLRFFNCWLAYSLNNGKMESCASAWIGWSFCFYFFSL